MKFLAVPITVMPKGVEHNALGQWTFIAGLCANHSDAERR